MITLLAAQAAVAVENARLYESATRWSRQLESLIEVGNALSGVIELPRVLQLVADRLQDLIDAENVFIAFPSGGRLVVQAAAGAGAERLVGNEVPDTSKSARILERGRSERVDSLLDDPEVDQEFARQARSVDRALRAAPRARRADRDRRRSRQVRARQAVHAGGPPPCRGVRDARRRRRRPLHARRARRGRPRRRRAGARAHATRARAPRRDRAGVDVQPCSASARSRRRRTRSSSARRRRDSASSSSTRSTTSGGSRSSCGRRRSTTSGSCPRSSDSRTPSPSRRRSRWSSRPCSATERLPQPVETALYRIVQEALTNVIKHSRASRVSVLVTRKPDTVAAVIEDDGVGFDAEDTRDGGLGLLGMRERIALLDGRLDSRVVVRRRDVDRRRGADPLMPIRVVLVDDHAVVRSGLRRVLEAEDGHRGRRGGGQRPRRRLRGPRAEARRDRDGRRDARAERDRRHAARSPRGARRRRCSSSRCRTTRATSARPSRPGASGYVLKEAADTDVVEAVREVAEGSRYLHPALGARLMDRRRASARKRRPTRSPSASARCSGCSRSATRTRRSRSCSTSRCGRPSRTGRTSCRSSGSGPEPSSCATRSPTGCSRRTPHPDQ